MFSASANMLIIEYWFLKVELKNVCCYYEERDRGRDNEGKRMRMYQNNISNTINDKVQSRLKLEEDSFWI